MSEMRQIRATIRTRLVPDVVRALEKNGVDRIFVSHVHVLGAGVDPERFSLSLEDGEAYTEKVILEFVCEEEEVETALSVLRERAGTGHRGDGVAIVSPVTKVVSIRTGDTGRLALL